jgi:hypothetical protein
MLWLWNNPVVVSWMKILLKMRCNVWPQVSPVYGAVLERTQRAMPARTRDMPSQVSGTCQTRHRMVNGPMSAIPFEMAFPSAHHSPSTVKRNAKELVIGTVRLNSRMPIRATPLITSQTRGSQDRKRHLPASPTIRKNHTEPLRFMSNGTKYAGLRTKSKTEYQMDKNFLFTWEAFLSSNSGLEGGT